MGGLWHCFSIFEKSSFETRGLWLHRPQLVGGFKHFFIFHNIWDHPSHWLIFFRGIETTTQIIVMIFPSTHNWNCTSKEGIEVESCGATWTNFRGINWVNLAPGFAGSLRQATASPDITWEMDLYRIKRVPTPSARQPLHFWFVPLTYYLIYIFFLIPDTQPFQTANSGLFCHLKVSGSRGDAALEPPQ